MFKNRTASGRNQVLNFRSLRGGPNVEIVQEENLINISLQSEVTLSKVQADDALVLPRVARHQVESPVNGMFVYDDTEHRFYGYAKNRWVPTRHSLDAGPNIELLQSENEIDIKLKDQIEVETIVATRGLLPPQRNIDEVANPVNGMIVYDNISEKFYGRANNTWVALH